MNLLLLIFSLCSTDGAATIQSATAEVDDKVLATVCTNNGACTKIDDGDDCLTVQDCDGNWTDHNC